MIKLKKVLRDSILRSDLLSTQASLRYGGQPVYQSFCPALVSIIMVGAFLTIFVLKFMTVLQLQDITAFQHLTDNIESSKPISNVMFAVTIDGLDMTTLDKYFKFTLTQVSLSRPSGSTVPKVRTETDIIMAPCKIDYWQSMGITDMSTIFVKRGMSSFYCPAQQFSIQGSTIQDTFIWAEIKLKPCTVADASCQTNAATRSAYYQSYVTANDYFLAKIYVRDTMISPTQENSVSNFLERDVLLSFSTTTGTVGYIKMADYQVDTDVSIWPWTQYQTQTGYFIERFQTTTIPTSNKFLYLKLEKSTKKLNVERQYGKLADMLSYVGGLFGLLFYCIKFFMTSYNEYRFELAVGQVLFSYDDKGNQFKENDMGFWNYIKYSLYDWLEFLGWQPACWQSMKKIHETREEANAQMDVRYLMKKISYLENVAQVLVSQEQRYCLHLTELPTIEKLRKIRRVSEFYNLHKEPNNPNNESQDLQQKILNNSKSVQIQDMIDDNNNSREKSLKDHQNSHENILPINIFDYRVNPTNEKVSVAKTDVQNQNDLDLELYGALLRLGQNDRDPMNQKILGMLRPQLVTKIKMNSRGKSADLDNSSVFIEMKKEKKMKRQKK